MTANDLVIDGQPEAIDAIHHAIVEQVGLGRHQPIAVPSGKTARPTAMTDDGQF
jgi:hypothetical protein